MSREQQKILIIEIWLSENSILKKKITENNLKIVGTLIMAIESGLNQKKLHCQPRNQEATQIEKNFKINWPKKVTRAGVGLTVRRKNPSGGACSTGFLWWWLSFACREISQLVVVSFLWKQWRKIIIIRTATRLPKKIFFFNFFLTIALIPCEKYWRKYYWIAYLNCYMKTLFIDTTLETFSN